MPRTQANLNHLRERFGEILGNRKDDFTERRIPALLERLGLSDCEEFTSKRDYLRSAVYLSSDEQIVRAASIALEILAIPVVERDELQDLVWNDGFHPVVPARYRRDVARQLEQVELCLDKEGFFEVLGAFWRVDHAEVITIFELGPTLNDQIEKHYVHESDWDTSTLFDKLGVYKCSDARFVRFIEALASSRVRPDENAQRLFISAVNLALKPCGVHFVVTPGADGYLIGSLAYIGTGARSSPKNLIFASSIKPDLRFSNALDNDVEVVTNADMVLIYDKPIGAAGLLWRDLQSWYEEEHGLKGDAAKEALYRRLFACLPDSSPPQRLAFTSYYKAFPKADIPRLPVLLPEVWFHWDPQTAPQRGKEALLRSRMDFLLLLPGGVRVVIEVDGQHHYATDDGWASPKRYSDMMAADRLLRLSGYEVYRFGGYELSQPGAEETLTKFYLSLIKTYSIL